MRIRHATAFVLGTMLALAGIGPPAHAQDRTIGERVDDATLNAKVKAKLVAERAGNLVKVNVDTKEGVVTLKGVVPTAEDKARAEELARLTAGVKSVVNELTVEGRAAGATDERAPATAAPAASPATGFIGRHTMTGEVTDIDAATGKVELRTSEGELHLHFPPSSLQNVRRGDRLTVELAVREAR
jgi:hyperosmotically inducible periplasmic protein